MKNGQVRSERDGERLSATFMLGQVVRGAHGGDPLGAHRVAVTAGQDLAVECRPLDLLDADVRAAAEAALGHHADVPPLLPVVEEVVHRIGDERGSVANVP